MPVIVACPSCARQLRVPDNLLGQTVKCPSCATVFTAAEPPPPEPAPLPATTEFTPQAPPPAPDLPPFEPLPAPDWQPRWGPEVRQAAAADRVTGPALALQITSGIIWGLSALLLLLMCGLGTALMGGAFGPQGNKVGRGGADPAVEMVTNSISLAFSLVWEGVIFYGALQMRRLRNWGFSLAAAIMALIPCSGCCLLTFPFGIWAIVVLADQDVKDAFR